MDDAALLMDRIEQLGRLSESPDMLVRRSYTSTLRAEHDLVSGWMREAGMAVREDAAGNLIGRYDGLEGARRILILGSHLDSVRDAGKYDGPLGVLAGIAAVARLQGQAERLRFAVEVVAFADEEGLRFHSSYLGSSAMAGVFPHEWLARTDDEGISIAEAIESFGGSAADIASCARRPEQILGYCEVHIEQGPLLEAEDLPVGVVDAISGQQRMAVEFKGVAGHAGTVPMTGRRDALCASAEFILEVERHGLATDGLVATVGQIAALPGASNVIPGQVSLSLDVRHSAYPACMTSVETLRSVASAIAERREVASTWTVVQGGAPTPCSPALVGALATAIEQIGLPVRHLVSGAGHDGVPMSRLTGIAMLFVRCKDGVSHNPAESVRTEDVGVALDVLHRFLLALDPNIATRIA